LAGRLAGARSGREGRCGMEDQSRDRPLDRISTLWSVVCQARGGEPEAADAREQLLRRYGGAVRREPADALGRLDRSARLHRDPRLPSRGRRCDPHGRMTSQKTPATRKRDSSCNMIVRPL
jgi:hypothetical protein